MPSRAGRRPYFGQLRGIYALVDPQLRPPVPFVDALLAGGIRLFQIRAKLGIAAETLDAIVTRVRAAGGLTLVNDDVAAAAAADGVHLGQEDAAAHDLRAVRARLPHGVIGLSCGTPAEARAVDPDLIDYIGIGPLFATGSKADAGLPIGVNGVRAVVDACEVPAAAIGGIDRARLSRARESGVQMAAVMSALAGGSDPAATARSFVGVWNA